MERNVEQNVGNLEEMNELKNGYNNLKESEKAKLQSKKAKYTKRALAVASLLGIGATGFFIGTNIQNPETNVNGNYGIVEEAPEDDGNTEEITVDGNADNGNNDNNTNGAVRPNAQNIPAEERIAPTVENTKEATVEYIYTEEQTGSKSKVVIEDNKEEIRKSEEFVEKAKENGGTVVELEDGIKAVTDYDTGKNVNKEENKEENKGTPKIDVNSEKAVEIDTNGTPVSNVTVEDVVAPKYTSLEDLFNATSAPVVEDDDLSL